MNGQDTSLAKVLQGQSFVPGTTTSKRMYAYQKGIETDWQRAVLRDGLQKNFQGGLTGSSPDTRYNVSGNYFNQQGAFPDRETRAETHSAPSTTSRNGSASARALPLALAPGTG